MSRPVGAKREEWWGEVRAVLWKDIRSELRTRAALATILLFALVTLVIAAFTVKTTGFGFTQELVPGYRELVRADPDAELLRTVSGTGETRAFVLAALLWIILFFSGMAGLPRVFVKEEEMRTAPALRLYVRPSAVFTGKLLVNAVLMLLVAGFVFPLFLILWNPHVARWPELLASVAAGTLGMAGAATLLGAIVARAGGKSYLMLPLAFPVLLPILVLSINGTAAALQGKPGNLLVALVSYVVAMVTVSAMLFEFVWSDG